jgi:ribosomal-protein-alanine acetyltransferase
LNIRLATAADLPAVMALEQACASAAHWTEAQYQNLFNNEIPESSRLLLLIDEPLMFPEKTESTLFGFLVARRIDDEWELENIAVAPAVRRKAIGTRLLKEFFRLAGQVSGKSIFLEVRESNHPARAFYEKFEFTQIARRKAYYQNPLEDALIYRRLI